MALGRNANKKQQKKTSGTTRKIPFHKALKDYSVSAMVGLPVLAGLRRGELFGLRWKDVDFKNKRIDVANQRVQILTGSIEKVPKGGKDNGKTREERKQRYAGLPDCLATLLHYVWDQQKDLLDREPEPEEYVFMTKTNLVNGYPPHPERSAGGSPNCKSV